jgi:hypothetical protein
MIQHVTPLPKTIGAIEKNSREQVRIALQVFKGHNLVDMRVLTVSGAVPMVTAKGITVNVAKLPELISLLQTAQAEALALGLIEGGDE